MIPLPARPVIVAVVDLTSFDAYAVVDIFLLLLIGVGPKIALVPFVELTATMDATTKASVARRMLSTASLVALLLVGFGELLTRLLHFSTGALSVASGIILFLIAVSMIRGTPEPGSAHPPPVRRHPEQLAVFPLAVPYLLNPVGFVVLVTTSADAATIGHVGIVIGLLALVLLIDVVVFRWANRMSSRLDPSRMLVTEKVFGFLLAALGVELVLSGLHVVGAIHLNGH